MLVGAMRVFLYNYVFFLFYVFYDRFSMILVYDRGLCCFNEVNNIVCKRKISQPAMSINEIQFIPYNFETLILHNYIKDKV